MPSAESETALERALREHEELRWEIGQLREFLAQPRPAVGRPGAHRWAASLAERLVRMHDLLFRHFREEESSGGWLEGVARQHPRAANRAEAFEGEHSMFLRELRDVTGESMRYSEGEAPDDPALRQRLNALLENLERHEMLETDLIQELTCHDLGTGD